MIDKEALLESLEGLLLDLSSGKPAREVLLEFTKAFPLLEELDLLDFDVDERRELGRDRRHGHRRLELTLRRFVELLQERIDHERG